MTDTEREALCARIDELCQENERMRTLADGAMNEADRLTHDAAALQIENAKLRMLCADMFEDCVDECDKWRYADRMRELEIEVPE